jgi:hypothetical protein
VIEVVVREETVSAPMTNGGADAVTESDVGLDRLPLFVAEIVFVPAEPAV